MTIYEYVALNNPIGAKNVLNSFGKKAVPRPDILAKQLATIVNQHGKDALYRIASIHPDLELLTHYQEQHDSLNKKEECDCKKKESIFSSAEGRAIKKAVEDIGLKQASQDALNNIPKSEPKSDKTELMIIAAVVVVGLALVLKK